MQAHHHLPGGGGSLGLGFVPFAQDDNGKWYTADGQEMFDDVAAFLRGEHEGKHDD